MTLSGFSLPRSLREARKPALAMVLAAGVLAPALGAVVVTNAAASGPQTVAAADAASVVNAPAARLMGANVAGMGGGAWVHSVDVDRLGRPTTVTVQRHAGFLGLSTARERVSAEQLSYSPARNLVIVSDRLG